MPDDEKPDPASQPYQTAAEAHGITERVEGGVSAGHHDGLSHTPGLSEVPDSKVPFAEHSHVHGPQQAAVDPVAAGLDTRHLPFNRAENRVIDRTGEIGSGVHAPGTTPAVSDGSQVKAPIDPPTLVSALPDKSPDPGSQPPAPPPT